MKKISADVSTKQKIKISKLSLSKNNLWKYQSTNKAKKAKTKKFILEN